MLLAYAGQLLGASAHAAQMMVPYSAPEVAQASCHGNENQVSGSDQGKAQAQDKTIVGSGHNGGHYQMSSEMPLDTSSVSLNSVSNDCCDDKDCSMSFCHATSAPLQYSTVWQGATPHTLNALIPSLASIAPPPNLFRPPIIA